MSTIPLSAKNVPPEGLREYGPMDVSDRADAGSNARLDSVIDKALEHMPDDDAVPTPKAERKSMDDLISEGLDKHEAAIEDREQFAASRADREELQSYYSEQGDLGQTLETFLQWKKAFQANPQQAGWAFAEAFMGMTPYALKQRENKELPPTRIIDGKMYSGEKLSAIINDAIDHATDEKKTYESTATFRQQLKEAFPGKSFSESVKALAKINRDAIADPLGTAATLAFRYLAMAWREPMPLEDTPPLLQSMARCLKNSKPTRTSEQTATNRTSPTCI
jgi:hypothetical protein